MPQSDFMRLADARDMLDRIIWRLYGRRARMTTQRDTDRLNQLLERSFEVNAAITNEHEKAKTTGIYNREWIEAIEAYVNALDRHTNPYRSTYA